MVSIRVLQLLLSVLLLSGCTFFFDVQDAERADSEPDFRQQQTIAVQVHRIVESMRDVGISEVSNIGPNEAQSGPEKWTMCSRVTFSGELRYFTFFLKDEKVVDWRPAVINDRCERRSYSSVKER